jgi:hypothetical protein
MAMKNQAEIYKALLDGKKIRNIHWEKDNYVLLNKKGKLISHKGSREKCDFHYYADYEITRIRKYTFLEAVELMKQGKKMTHPNMDHYLFYDNDTSLIYTNIGSIMKFYPSYIEKNEWTIYEPEEPEDTETQTEKDTRALDDMLKKYGNDEFQRVKAMRDDMQRIKEQND